MYRGMNRNNIFGLSGSSFDEEKKQQKGPSHNNLNGDDNRNDPARQMQHSFASELKMARD